MPRFPREKKKEQEREELWEKLDELQISHSGLAHSNSHMLHNANANNNVNNNNNNRGGGPPDPAQNEDMEVDAPPATVPAEGPPGVY